MKEIALCSAYRCQNSGLYVALVDDEDCEYLSTFSWGVSVTKAADGTPYVRARRSDRSTGRRLTIHMHREVWARSRGPIPSGMTIDHIEHGRYGALDNRRSNLRVASRKDQQGNRRKVSTRQSQWKGTHWDSRNRKWSAYITIRGKSRNLWTFISEEDAARAYDTAALIHFGHFARLNMPPEATA